MRSSSRFLTVLARPNGQELARLGVIIAKRHVKKAVLRNRIRRLIRENFRHQQSQLIGLDFVVLLRMALAKPEQIGLLKNTLEQHCQELVQKWKNG
jgi:ribonuclease P protein component